MCIPTFYLSSLLLRRTGGVLCVQDHFFTSPWAAHQVPERPHGNSTRKYHLQNISVTTAKHICNDSQGKRCQKKEKFLKSCTPSHPILLEHHLCVTGVETRDKCTPRTFFFIFHRHTHGMTHTSLSGASPAEMFPARRKVGSCDRQTKRSCPHSAFPQGALHSLPAAIQSVSTTGIDKTPKSFGFGHIQEDWEDSYKPLNASHTAQLRKASKLIFKLWQKHQGSDQGPVRAQKPPNLVQSSFKISLCGIKLLRDLSGSGPSWKVSVLDLCRKRGSECCPKGKRTEGERHRMYKPYLSHK